MDSSFFYVYILNVTQCKALTFLLLRNLQLAVPSNLLSAAVFNKLGWQVKWVGESFLYMMFTGVILWITLANKNASLISPNSEES